MDSGIVSLSGAVAWASDSESLFVEPSGVHTQQYQKQQGNSTAILIRSCKLGEFDPQRNTFLLDRQQHLFVARFLSPTVDPDTSPVDRRSVSIVNRRHSSVKIPKTLC
ncbi:hypothetical protein DY000_02031180 [Brassica cretica]|uniref:Uncharacterized protein n=1 Tax=Brassica cretica TaxID=69181 RepID=A0ABQ7DZU1_BRACR|nr:hypothetical protein DY000_02031180 [Brassica cretica]